MSNQVARNSYERYYGSADDRWQLLANQTLPGGGTGTNNIIWNSPIVYNLNDCYFLNSGAINITKGGLYALNVTLQIAQTSGQPTNLSSWVYLQHGTNAGESAATTFNIYPAISGLTFTYAFSYLASVAAGDNLAIRVLNHDVVYNPAIDDVATELRISKIL